MPLSHIDPRFFFVGYTRRDVRVHSRVSRARACVHHAISVVTYAISSSFLFIMASTERSDEAVCERSEQQSDSQLQNGTAGNNGQQNDQPQPQQQQGSMWKSLLVRMFIFWVISQLFRGRGQQQSTTTNTFASTNVFKTDQKMVS